MRGKYEEKKKTGDAASAVKGVDAAVANSSKKDQVIGSTSTNAATAATTDDVLQATAKASTTAIAVGTEVDGTQGAGTTEATTTTPDEVPASVEDVYNETEPAPSDGQQVTANATTTAAVPTTLVDVNQGAASTDAKTTETTACVHNDTAVTNTLEIATTTTDHLAEKINDDINEAIMEMDVDAQRRTARETTPCSPPLSIAQLASMAAEAAIQDSMNQQSMTQMPTQPSPIQNDDNTTLYQQSMTQTPTPQSRDGQSGQDELGLDEESLGTSMAGVDDFDSQNNTPRMAQQNAADHKTLADLELLRIASRKCQNASLESAVIDIDHSCVQEDTEEKVNEEVNDAEQENDGNQNNDAEQVDEGSQNNIRVVRAEEEINSYVPTHSRVPL